MSDSICKHSRIALSCSECAAEREARRREEEEQQENEN